MDFVSLKRVASTRIEDICKHLFPKGEVRGSEFFIGDLQGNKGSSLRVNISGHKAGVWADFSGEDKGDIIDLWSKAKTLSIREAMDELMEFLGVEEVFDTKKELSQVSVKSQEPKEVLTYLKSRGLTEETIKAFRVGEIKYKYNGKEEVSVVFPSYKDDKLVRAKFMALRRVDGKKQIQVTPNSSPILFGWHLINGGKAVCIREGEINAMTLHQYGIPSLALALGAGSGNQHAWVEYDYRDLEKFETIYISTDSDEAGVKAANEIANRLGIHRCKLVHFPQGKDPNDLLQEGYTKDQIREFFKKAQSLEPAVLKRPTIFIDEVIRRFYPPDGERVGWSPTMLKMRQGNPPLVEFRYGETTVVTGINSHGKSAYLDQLILDGISFGETFVLASLEQKAAMTLKRQVIKATTKMHPPQSHVKKVLEFLDGKEYIYDKLHSLTMKDFFQNVEYAVKRYGATNIVLDSLMCLEDVSEESNDSQKKAINSFAEFCKNLNVHGFLVAHPRKSINKYQRIDRINISGSGKISDRADNVLSVWRNHAREEWRAGLPERMDDGVAYETQPDGLIIIDKQRDTGETPTFSVWYDKESTQLVENEEAIPKLYVPETSVSF